MVCAFIFVLVIFVASKNGKFLVRCQKYANLKLVEEV